MELRLIVWTTKAIHQVGNEVGRAAHLISRKVHRIPTSPSRRTRITFPYISGEIIPDSLHWRMLASSFLLRPFFSFSEEGAGATSKEVYRPKQLQRFVDHSWNTNSAHPHSIYWALIDASNTAVGSVSNVWRRANMLLDPESPPPPAAAACFLPEMTITCTIVSILRNYSI